MCILGFVVSYLLDVTPAVCVGVDFEETANTLSLGGQHQALVQMLELCRQICEAVSNLIVHIN